MNIVSWKIILKSKGWGGRYSTTHVCAHAQREKAETQRQTNQHDLELGKAFQKQYTGYCSFIEVYLITFTFPFRGGTNELLSTIYASI